MENLRWYLSLFKPYKWILLVALLGVVLESLSYSGLSFLLKELIDRVLIGKDFHLLVLTVAALLLLGFLKQIGFLLGDLLYKYTTAKVSLKLRLKMYSKILSLPLEEFQKYPLGEWVGRITNDVKSFREYSEGVGLKVFRDLFTALSLTGVLLYFDWQLFLLFLLATPPLVLVFSYFGRKRKKYSKLYQETFAGFINFITDLFGNFESVKFLSRVFLNSLTKGRVFEIFRTEFKNALYTDGYLSAIELVGYAFVSLILLYGGYRVVNGDLSAGTFISFIGTLFLLYNSLQSLQRSAMAFKALEPIIVRLREVLENPNTERGGSKNFSLNREIRTENLTFKGILRDVNLRLLKGKKYLVKGASGGGKSTLLKVLSGLYRTYGGKVFFDDTELREFLISDFRKGVFYLSQTTPVFNDTVRNNLLLANPKATEERLKEALKLARAEFVFDLPQGLDTLIGGGGVELSGGQKQRIALARLFLTNAKVLFLDEATSALDPKTEAEVLNNLLSRFADRTLLFVSHREGYEELFDGVVKVENGKVSTE